MAVVGAHSIADDTLFRYQASALPCFDLIKESATRLAGLLVQSTLLGQRSAVLDGDAFDTGREVVLRAKTLFAGISADGRYGHFHTHLGAALLHALDAWAALEAKRRGVLAAPDPLPPLDAAWAQMKLASRLLPGFEVVDFGSSCCAMHIQQAQQTR